MNNETACWAILPAAGIGERFGSNIPKQYVKIADKTILEHALKPFLTNENITGVAVALNSHDDHFSNLQIKTSKQFITTVGGETRAHSVLNALIEIENLLDRSDFVLVHDAARPCLSHQDLNALIENTIDLGVGSILAGPVADTVKRVEGNTIVETIDRSDLWHAYTPQMFRYHLLFTALKKCIDKNISITDEASAIEEIGLKVNVLRGDSAKVKITIPQDLKIAEKFLSVE
ncbi:MAG: 2-C-methyl-D-erythritol 4-phosphate cytidylyltransferase [Pseudomonadota bacterium]